MDENSQTTPPVSPAPNGKGLGTAGLIVGIVALLFSFIPCLGMYAALPAVVGIILSAIAMSQASKAGAPKGMALGGLICSIVGLIIAIYWIYAAYFMMHHSTEALMEISKDLNENGGMDSLNKALEQLKDITDTMPH